MSEGCIKKVKIITGGTTIQGVSVPSSGAVVNEVFHDNTLKGTGQPSNELGIAESVLQDIASKVSDVQVNGESVVAEGVADITVGDATITIQKNGTDIDSFTANETTDKTINVEVPTTLRELSTVAEQNALDSGITSAGVEQITTNKNDIATANGEINTINSKIPYTASSENKLTDKDYVDGEISSLDGDITDINNKIPAQASSENKLADKNFVNSSIATNTANFIGTFNSVAELEAYSGTVTNNDYAFVVSEDSAGNTIYNRYKYTTATTPASWVFEYELNNSSFTADQWAAINSGATTTNIGQIATNTSTISGHIADKDNPHQVTKAQVGLGNCNNTSDADKPISTATQTALDNKVDKTTTANQVYTTNGNGEQSYYPLSINAIGNSFAYRTSDAQVRVATTPSGNNDATSKKYVDDGLALKQDEATALNYNYISNCIKNIPQDIKLELNNGTLTLKAGSKIYVPNGAGVFDEVVLTVDKTITPSTFSTSSNRMIIYRYGSIFVLITTLPYVYSGDTAPTTFDSNGRAFWYDTANNNIKYTDNSGSTWTGDYAFPIALVNITNGIGITAINQTFNGFGYIGSTIYALPGVKGLVPNGRNADGTLKNTLLTKQSVNVFTPSSATFSQITNIALGSTLSYHTFTYDEVNNKTSASGYMNAGDITWTNGKITSFTPKIAFHAVDYSDTDFIGHQAMPSGRHTPFTLPSSGQTVTAPADGYIVFSKASNAANQYVIMACDATLMNTMVMVPVSGAIARCFLPVSKGDAVRITYDLGGSTSIFHFVYANGSK